MADHSIQFFKSGTQNLLSPEIINPDASQDALNWISVDGRLKLVNGRKLTGNELGVGKVTGLHFGYKVDGSKVLYRKIKNSIQWLNGLTWVDLITGLTTDSEYSFANYSSLAGAFTFVSGIDGVWKIINANQGVVKILDNTSPFRGRILIDKGRTLMWNVPTNKTTLYHSHIDVQKDVATSNGGYTTISGEATTSLTGTLAFKAGGATRSAFGVRITLTGSGEVFTDNYLGILTGTLGNTGTINYATGAYTLSVAGTGTATYLWENSISNNLFDFSSSSPRKAGEGNFYSQDVGGDAILSVLISVDGDYYSMKSQSSYRLTLSSDDTTGTNDVFRSDMGVPSFGASISSNKGIVFINTANPDKPEMTVLQKNLTSNNLEPVILFPHFKFSNYDYSDCTMFTWERYVLISCKKQGSINNDTILLCDMATGIIDITGYSARMFAKDNGNLYVGSPLTQNVYQVFNGFDDDGDSIQNYWSGKDDQYMMAVGLSRSLRYQIGEHLKKFRKFKVKGLIDPNQAFEVYASFDNSGFQLIGTIRGSGSYVDYNSPQTIGSNMIGESQLGGDDITNVYPFFTEFSVKMPKFRSRTLKFVATGIGYCEIQFISDYDLMIFEPRLPSRFRQKQHISLDGLQTDLPNTIQ